MNKNFCSRLMNIPILVSHIFVPPICRFWKVTTSLPQFQSNIMSPSKTSRLVTNIWPQIIKNKPLNQIFCVELDVPDLVSLGNPSGASHSVPRKDFFGKNKKNIFF